MPSSTEPRMMKATMVIARKPARPPGTPAMMETSHCEKPDWVKAHAMAVAVPTISMTAPVNATVSTSSG